MPRFESHLVSCFTGQSYGQIVFKISDEPQVMKEEAIDELRRRVIFSLSDSEQFKETLTEFLEKHLIITHIHSIILQLESEGKHISMCPHLDMYC